MSDQPAKCTKCSKFSNCSVVIDVHGVDGRCTEVKVEQQKDHPIADNNLAGAVIRDMDASASAPKVEEINRERVPIFHITSKSSSVKRYTGLCSCHESKEKCKCASNNVSIFERVLPRSAPSCWPRLKITCFVIAGSLPWIFLIIYFVLHYM